MQLKRKKRAFLLSLVAASLLLVFLTIVILSPPPALSPKSADETADIAGSGQPETGNGATEEGSSVQKTDEAKDERAKYKGGPFVIEKNADGTRKRPTFGPEDENSYWE